MIADDAKLFRDYVKAAVNLVNIDANFIEVSDGKKLFPTYEKHVPEITLVDSKLPNADVLDFVKKLVGIHQIATIIIFVDSLEHVFVKQARQLGIEEILQKTIDQFSLGSIIKKHLDKKIPKYQEFEKKTRSTLINALTLSTLDKSKDTSQYVKLVNASIQKGIARIENLKKLGEDFDITIKKLSNGNSLVENQDKTATKPKFAPQNSPYFFMREFSNEELNDLLRKKIKELKEMQAELKTVNNRLQETVTELEETKQELIEQKEQLEEQVQIQARHMLKAEKLAIIGELSARIAHDLRNPLNVIKNTSDILKLSLSDRLNEDETQKWMRLEKAIFRISHQLDDVLDFIKHRPIQKTNVKISKLLGDVLERIAIPHNVEICLPQNDADILCDSEKMGVVFVNLILNAIQAMDGRLGTIYILVSENHKDKDYVEIEVRDTGPGIPESLWSRIFDPLFTTRQIGTGLGLTSCKSIVERHGGTITFTSKMGVGTSFFIKLPKKTEWENIKKE
ncbi:MAG: ATP-binding protein [Candidatus Nitrosotenuis sp.]